MKLPRALHRWDVTATRAVEIQRRLAPRVIVQRLRRRVRRVVGVDLAFLDDGKRCVAGAVLWDVDQGRVVEEQTAVQPVRFPYVPGLLSFREAPAVLAVLRKLRGEPDVIMLDGQGLAHPRRFGLACHVGLLSDRPAIGCAKSRLVGTHREPKSERGSRTALVDRHERIGAVLRTRDRINPIYVSVGHRMDLPGAIDLALACGDGYRIPAPTRLADRLVARFKRPP